MPRPDRLRFPACIRVELSWVRLPPVALLLAPVPARLKEWAYAGITITSALLFIAHPSVGDGPSCWLSLRVLRNAPV